MPESPARRRLLEAAVERAMRDGIADLSLRELAAAIGTSHRMLLYHFGSREGLLAAVSSAVDAAQRVAIPRTLDEARALWARVSDPALWPQERLFFELYAHGLRGRPGIGEFPAASVEPWISAIADTLIDAGADPAAARAQARLGLAVARGLLLDLLATGDRSGVDEAYEAYLGYLGQHRGTG